MNKEQIKKIEYRIHHLEYMINYCNRNSVNQNTYYFKKQLQVAKRNLLNLKSKYNVNSKKN
jgi:hypothetical protein